MRRDFARTLHQNRSALDARHSAGTQVPSAQQDAANAALAVHRGLAPHGGLRGPARELFDTLTETQLVMLAEGGRSDGSGRTTGTSGGAAPRA
jgi:hypothetical protein